MSAQEINSLYEQLNQYILGNFTLFWAIIAVVIATIGGALYCIAKVIIDRRVEKELGSIKSRLDQTLGYQEKLLSLSSDFTFEKGTWTPSINKEISDIDAKGDYVLNSGTCFLSGQITFHNAAPKERTIVSVTGVPFTFNDKEGVNIGMGTLIVGNKRTLYNVMPWGYTRLMFVSDVYGYLCLSEIEEDAVLLVQMIYAKM